MAKSKRLDPVIVSTAQLAMIFSLSERRIQQLRTSGMPRVGHGRWDLKSVIPWYLEQMEKTAHPQNTEAEEAQRRYYLARAGLTEHKEAEARGQAISLAEHTAVVSELCTDLTMEIDSFPLREYNQPEDRNIATRICDRLRARLAQSVAPKSKSKRTANRVPKADAPATAQR